MASFSAPTGYSELRPAYTSEAFYFIVVAPTSSVLGQTFVGAFFKPDGSAATGAVTAAVVSGGVAVLLTLPGQTVAGAYVWNLRRTDDASQTVIANGIVDVLNPV